MPDLNDGESTEMKGSGARPYVLKNTGGVYSCTCPAWRNQSVAIERRTCKHLRRLRGDAAEEARLGGALPQKPIKSSGEETAAAGPPLLLAESWDNAADLSGWWMSEKLDGVRAYWDGRQFLSRQGNLFHAPDWFTRGLPAIPLDGELWIDRKKFQRTVSIVRRQDKTDLWQEVRYLVFDAPDVPGGFEDRLAALKAALAGHSPQYAKLHLHQPCPDVACLRAELARVESLGGEGLMLRQPNSPYEAGRSTTLLKVKSFLDAEAVVIAHLPGAGKHKGRLGALLARLPSGVEFSIGTGFSDRERDNPSPIGASVTFRYQELSEAGVPRFPSYVRLRPDVPTPAIPTARETLRSSGKDPMKEKMKEPARQSAVPLSSPAAASSSGTSGKRYFELIDDKSSKFWEISQSGPEFTTRWGRIGSAGQSKTKALADPAAAAAQVAKLLKEKTGEGYVEKS